MTTVLESLNQALHAAMQADSRVFVLGEDILDPYGGAFKVTRGLSTRFPARVLTTPISEAGITGLAAGMGLRGLRPVVEIMFGDFLTLAFDQLVNHAAKFRWMYNDQVRVPIVVRTPMGGRRGYGPTHSQSLEKHLLGVPGLKVMAPNTLGDPASLLRAAIAEDDPVVFIEHKLLYPRPCLVPGEGDLVDFHVETAGDPCPVHHLRPVGTPSLTIATYGHNFELARAAALELMLEYELFCEVVVFSQLSPFDLSLLPASVGRTGALLTLEEGTLSLGWGAEVASRLAEAGLSFRLRRIAGRDLPIPTARSLEDQVLPAVEDVVRSCLALARS